MCANLMWTDLVYQDHGRVVWRIAPDDGDLATAPVMAELLPAPNHTMFLGAKHSRPSE